MKDLITVFTYCPDNKRKKVLEDLLDKLKIFRNKFDILVVSHSQIPELCYDNIDYFYYDKNNVLLYDFDLNNNFWFKSESFYINSTTVYPKSTHLAIYNLLYYTFNFAKHKNYNKVHCIEYDINLTNEDLFSYVSNLLDDSNTVMFQRQDGWIYGTYFAFNMEDFPESQFIYNEEEILNTLRDSDSRMTENITPLILSPNNRTIHFEPLSKLDPTGIYQKIDTHSNNELNWCVPVCDKHSNDLYLFVYNNNGGEFKVDCLNGEKHTQIVNNNSNTWTLTPIGNIENTNKIIIIVNDEIKKEVTLTEKNKEKFKNYNFVEFV
jgi:hypothetical protein